MTISRLSCVVPGCRHTRGQRKGEGPIREGQQWVCGEHWRAVPKQMRGILARARRRANRRPTENNIRSFQRLWDRSAREAIERGMGLR